MKDYTSIADKLDIPCLRDVICCLLNDTFCKVVNGNKNGYVYSAIRGADTCLGKYEWQIAYINRNDKLYDEELANKFHSKCNEWEERIKRATPSMFNTEPTEENVNKLINQYLAWRAKAVNEYENEILRRLGK